MTSSKIYTKLPKSPAKNLAQLKERGLVITDESRAINYLMHIGYYRLSAYCIPFEASKEKTSIEHQFQEGTSFDQILQLYVFDRKLRMLVMEAIERIEVSLRSNWVNALTLEANNAHAYMDVELFRDPWLHQRSLSKAVCRLRESKEAFIQHYKNTYKQPFLPPTWAMAETLTFGELSQWFENTQGVELKKTIIKNMGLLPAIEISEKVMECLSLIRNICAHHGRLWNRKMVKQLPNIKRLSKHLVFEEVATKGKIQKQPSRKLYNYLFVINHLMQTIQPNTSWNLRLNELLDSTHNCNAL